MWNTGFLRRLSDAARDFVDDDVVVGRVAAQQASEADDGVVLLGLRQRASGGWNFEGAGNADNVMSFSVAPERSSPSYALRSSLSVMNSLKRETTIPKRNASAFNFPAIAFLRIFSSVAFSLSELALSEAEACRLTESSFIRDIPSSIENDRGRAALSAPRYTRTYQPVILSEVQSFACE